MAEIQQTQQKMEKKIEVNKPVGQQTPGINPVGENQEKKSTWWIWLILALVIVGVGIYFLLF